MDAATLLANTLSPDTQTRQDATNKLEAASRENYAEYMMMLSTVLGTESAEPHVRTAAGLALKNALSARDSSRQTEYSTRWLSLGQDIRGKIKQDTLAIFGSESQKTGALAAQVVTAIALVELPRGQWSDLVGFLLQAANSQGNTNLNVSALQTIGFICEMIKTQVLKQRSNEILRAFIHGARNHPASEVQLAAVQALFNSLEFLKENFDREDELNYIMQAIYEVSRKTSVFVKVAAFECLTRIMSLYYEKIGFYTGLGLFTMTVDGLTHSDERVVLQAISFWITVCEEERELAAMANEASEQGESVEIESKHFARAALPRIVPVLLNLLTNQDEHAEEGDWNVSLAAGSCISFLSQAVQDNIIPHVTPFIQAHVKSLDWRYREAAVMAFGSILDGPDPDKLTSLVKQALPLFIAMMADEDAHVRDTTAWTLGRICDLLVETIEPDVHLHPLVSALVNGLQDHARIATKCCKALGALVESYGEYCQDDGNHNMQIGPLSMYYQGIVEALLRIVERANEESSFRQAVNEAITSFISHATPELIPVVQNTAIVVLDRMEQLSQISNTVQDRNSWIWLQSSCRTILVSAIYQLNDGIQPLADRIMMCILDQIHVAGTHPILGGSLLVAGSLASVLGANFMRYVPSFLPSLYMALKSPEDVQLCTIANTVTGDLCRALKAQCAQFAGSFLDVLLDNLQRETLDKDLKVSILSCFGDIAVAIGPRFEPYLNTTVAIMRRASMVQPTDSLDSELVDYVDRLRTGVLITYLGIVTAFRGTNKAPLLLPHINTFLELVQICYSNEERTDFVEQLCTGLMEGIVACFANDVEQIKDLFMEESMSATNDLDKDLLAQEMARCDIQVA